MRTDRRTFLAGLAGAAAAASRPPESALYNGVELGMQSFSLKDRPLDRLLDACNEIGVFSVELWSGHLEPPRAEFTSGYREIVRRWRIEQGVEACNRARDQFAAAGVHINAFNLSLRNDATDEEIDAAFQMTRQLNVDILTSSSNVSTRRPSRPLCAALSNPRRISQSRAHQRGRVRYAPRFRARNRGLTASTSASISTQAISTPRASTTSPSSRRTTAASGPST